MGGSACTKSDRLANNVLVPVLTVCSPGPKKILLIVQGGLVHVYSGWVALCSLRPYCIHYDVSQLELCLIVSQY